MFCSRSAARHGALLVHRNDWTALIVSGHDRFAWPQRMLSCHLGPVLQGQSVYGLVLSPHGGIVADVVAMPLADSIVLAVSSAIAKTLLAHLDHHLVMEDAQIEALEAPHAFVVAIGPDATQVSLAAMATEHVMVSCAGRLPGMSAAVLLCACDHLSGVVEDLVNRNARWCAATLDEFDSLRVELGITIIGTDFGPENNPVEVGLDQHAVSFDKGCYVGQDVVAKLRARGQPIRALARLVFEPGAVPLSRAAVVANGTDVGVVTSVGMSQQEHPLAFAIVRYSALREPDALSVEGRGVDVAGPWGMLERIPAIPPFPMVSPSASSR